MRSTISATTPPTAWLDSAIRTSGIFQGSASADRNGESMGKCDVTLFRSFRGRNRLEHPPFPVLLLILRKEAWRSNLKLRMGDKRGAREKIGVLEGWELSLQGFRGGYLRHGIYWCSKTAFFKEKNTFQRHLKRCD